jgi:hypothetical protein
MSQGPSIYNLIDGLNDSKSIPDLVARLKPILEKLAYISEVGEGAAFQAHEQWHNEYTEALYEGTQGDYVADRENKRTQRAQPAQRQPPQSHSGPRKQQAPPTRANPGDIPSSLLAIMNGTHPTLNERT